MDKNNKIESRFFEDRAIKYIPGEDGPGILEGRGIVFNKWSKPVTFTDWKGRKVTWLEKIDASSIDDVDLSDILSYYNHVPPVLGRTSSKTLELRISPEGVDYSIKLPDTQAGKDVGISASRKDITGSSFQFRVAHDGEVMESKEDENTVTIKRTITKFEIIKEIGPVDDPAYSQTSAKMQRNFEGIAKEYLESKEKENKTPSRDRRRLKMRKRKLFNH